MKVHPLICGCIFLVAPVWGNSVGDVSQKSALMEKLDSIDMEKQIRKRKGQSLDDLEKKSSLLKDSIAAVKMGIDRTDGTGAAPKKNAGDAPRLRQAGRLLPHNAFDWVVLVFAAIALIAGVILCIGLVSMIWKTVKSGKKTPLKTMRENLSLREERSPPPENVPPLTEKNAELSEKRIDSLKKRIGVASENNGSPRGKPFCSPLPGGIQEPVSDADTNKDSNALDTAHLHDASPPGANLKSLILKAAREGADTMEISKRFHVGVDQVSLILRVAHRNDSDKP